MKNIFKFTIALLLITVPINMQAQKKNLEIKDYAQWQNLGSFTISDDGNWASYHVRLVDGDDTLYVKSLTGNVEYKYALSTDPQFSSDSKWLTMRMNFSEKKQEEMRESKKEIKNKLRLLNLQTGDVRVFKDIQTSSLTKDGKHIVMTTYSEKDKKTKDIYLLNLVNGAFKNIGNVKEFSVNKKGDRLAYITEANSSPANGVELLNLETYSSKTIDSDTTSYTDLRWHKEGKAFAFLKEYSDTGFVEKNHQVFAVKNIYGSLSIKTYDPAKTALPEGLRVRETYTPIFSEDLSIVYFGAYEWTVKDKKKKKKSDKEKLPGVDIWHWKDDPIQPRQEVTYSRTEANFTYLFAWNTANSSIVRISDEKLKNPRITGDGKKVLVSSDDAYKPQFRTAVSDFYLIDPVTGKKTEVIKEFPRIYGSSPDGKFLYYFKGKGWWIYDIAKNTHITLTADINSDFWNTRDDSPKDVKPPFGFGGWMEGDDALLVYDEYDIWKLFTNGSEAVKLTSGREEEIINRVMRLDYEEPYLKNDKDLFVRLNGDKTKWSGFGKISPTGKFKTLHYDNMAISGLTKAKDADKYLFSEQTYSDSPDVFVSEKDLKKKTQISNTNPQQKDYYWGKSELVEYTNKDGKKMQGALYYPANYEEGKQYPMIIYIYEIMSTRVHRYISPSETSAYNTSNYTSSGFFIFTPDIVYKTNHPGESAVDCVVPAVEEVLKTGMIDKDKIGIMGHSWGAYQTAFIITQTDLFSAAVAGAPLIDMISMYNEIYWNSGGPNQNIFETSQGRLREPWWDIMEEYVDNSPMFNANKIETPLLVAFGNKDGAVDWHQGIEMFTTMRRMEKPYIMLVYDGENHGLRKKENMKDYCTKTREFFEHQLLGKDAKEWIIKGKTFMQKKKEEELNKE